MADERTERVLDWLTTLPFFQDISRRELAVVLPRLGKIRLQDGDPLCEPGDPPGCCWVVVRGALQVLSPRGHPVSRVEAGSPFGLGTLLASRPRTLRAVAVGETWVLQMDRETWEDLIARRDVLSLHLAEKLASALAVQIREADEILHRLLERKVPAPAVAPGLPTAGTPLSFSPAPAPADDGTSRPSRSHPEAPSLSAGARKESPQPAPSSRGRFVASRLSEADLETFLTELESRVGLTDQTIRVVHTAEKPIRPKNPGF